MKILYNLFIHFYWLAIYLSSFFNSKAKLWIEGRKDIFKKIKLELSNQNIEVIWFHCASLGEFEQARPLIENYKSKLNLKNGENEIKILLTFFSPSGYEIRKNYSGADYICYLPIDSIANAKKFLDIINPAIAIFVKYEFWFNYLIELKNRNIPTYLVCGIFRNEHYLFKKNYKWFLNNLKTFNHFFLQDSLSEKLLNKNGYLNTSIAGDTRFDRVIQISKAVKPIPLMEIFTDHNKVFIAGSTWKEDEDLIAACLRELADFKIIIAPHQIDETHIQYLLRKFGNASMTLYSKANEDNINNFKILIVDNIGMLSSIYQYGSIAFVGGGFGKGIHNILEPAAFGLPVIFGTNFKKFNEAHELINLGGAFSIKDSDELKRTLKLLSEKLILQTASQISKFYVQNNQGATEKILEEIIN